METSQNRFGAKELAHRAIRWAKRHEAEATRALYASRRAAFIARMKLAAAWQGARVELDIAPDVRFGKDISIVVWPGSQTSLRIGPRCRLGDRTQFMLNGGRCDIGENVELRRDCVFIIWGGSLEFAGDDIITIGTVFHCASSIRIGRQVGIGEYVTIIDSSHYYTTPEEPMMHNIQLGPVEIGSNSLIAAKAVIARNSKVGDYCIVGGNSVVTGEVPEGHLASGVPAKLRELDLPWKPKLEAGNDAEQPPKKRAPRKPKAADPER